MSRTDLFTLETNRLRLTWSGPEASLGDGDVLGIEPLRADSAVRVCAGGEDHVVGGVWKVPLALTEEVRYTIFAQSRTGEKIEVRHRDPVLVNGLVSGDGGRVVHGRVTFGSQVGRSRFVVLVGGMPEVAFTVTVAPAKVGWSDVEALRSDVEGALGGLAVAYLRATTSGAISEAGRRPARPVWLGLLREALPVLERALGEVALRPRVGLHRPEEPARAARLRRPDPSVLRAVARGAGAGAWERLADRGGGVPVRAFLPARPPRQTLDTPAHRWLRARVEGAARRLAVVRREEAASRYDGLRRASAAEELAAMEGTLRRLLALAPLAEAPPDRPPPALPLVLRHVPGYAEAADALLALDVALTLADGPSEVVPLDLGALYETWAYLTVVRTAAGVLGAEVPPGDFFRAAARGVRLALRRGRAHAVRLAGEGVEVHVANTPRFDAPAALLAQRPDILLTVREKNRPPRLLVLDAKYRRDDGALYRRRHGAPGPPEDALGALHRYRDAIVRVGPAGVERPVEAAVALFPYREPEPGAFAASRLWASVEKIGVGAIPLLPGATGYLEEWLRRVLRR